MRIYNILNDYGRLFSINRKETISGKDEVGYTITGIRKLMDDTFLFCKDKEVNLADGFSADNDFLYPPGNIEIALYKKII